MSLRPIIAALKALEETLVLTDPIAVSVAAKNLRVYTISPGRAEKLSSTVNFMHWPDAASEERMGPTREDHYSIQIDCLVNVAEVDVGADIALAMFDLYWPILDRERVASRRLSSTVDYFTMRAERPMVEIIEWAGLAYPGFHIFLDIVDFEVSL